MLYRLCYFVFIVTIYKQIKYKKQFGAFFIAIFIVEQNFLIDHIRTA